MKALESLAVILVCVVILVLMFKLERCGEENPHAASGGSVVVPRDTSFAGIRQESYRPPSVPFSSKHLPAKLPEGVSERDVRQVTTIEVRSVPANPPKKIDIVETNEGDVYVMKDSSIVSVTLTTIEPPIFVLQARLGVGASFAPAGGNLTISPAVGFFPVEWLGWLELPAAFADKDGVGLGAEARIYHDIFAGVSHLWRYGGTSQVKFTCMYNF